MWKEWAEDLIDELTTAIHDIEDHITEIQQAIETDNSGLFLEVVKELKDK